ncbi:MAG: DUF4339 domain-containing protein [Gemmataceae bacterium]
MMLWYYSSGRGQAGPVDDRTLRSLAQSGRLKPSDLVWREGLDEWVRAETLTWLFAKSGPPPLLRSTALPPPLPQERDPGLDDPIVVWESWQVILFMLVTLGLFGFYLLPSWAKQVEHITGKRRMPFGAWLALSIFTLSGALYILEIAYAFSLERHGRQVGHPMARPNLGLWVCVLSIVSVVLTVATSGIGLILGGCGFGLIATWLVQSEINSYAVQTEEELPM